MIKHHPKLELLESYVAGELPASVCVMIAAHLEMCPKCQQQITELTAKAAVNCFETDAFAFDESEIQFDFDAFIDEVTEDTSIDEFVEPEPQEIKVADTPYCLPQVLCNLERSSWLRIPQYVGVRPQEINISSKSSVCPASSLSDKGFG